MYLSKLEIIGFKSFAQKTKFTFNEGISSIVGPNGCGKTNVVDAIRWVLGEQKSNVLRSEIMENVIFNGTKSRKPLNMAEVALTIENNKNILPIEYTEVTITRRLFRNGDSQYLINNSQCRLRDVIDLFMDTGLGSDSYSVIELKMVEAILSGKPEERRHLFEEAAGVNKYKLRRKEASRKLQNVQQDLTRVNDIVAEVEKQVNTLARQASKTKRYNKLMSRYKDLELNLLFNDYKNYKVSVDTYNADLTDLANQKTNYEIEIDESHKNLKELEHKLHIIDEKYQAARDNENAINLIIAQKTKEIAVNDERISSLKNNQIKIAREIEDNINNTENFNNKILESENRKIQIAAELETAKEELLKYSELKREEVSKVQSLREDANSANEECLNIQNAINTLKAELSKANLRKNSLTELIDKNSDEIDKVNKEIENNQILIQDTEKAKTELAEKLELAENTLKSEQERQNILNNELDNNRAKLSDKKNDLAGKKAALDFLSSLIEVDDSSKFLFASDKWKIEPEKSILEELVGTDDEYRIAVEAALGEIGRYFVVNNKEEAFAAINLLKENQKGKVSFIARNLVADIEIPSDIIKDEVIGLLSEIVRVDDCIRNLLRSILGKTYLVNDFETALKLSELHKDSCFVSLKGEIANSKGFIRGGAVLKKEGLSVGKKERIEKLKSVIDILMSEISDLESAINKFKSELAAIDLRKLNDNIRSIANEISRAEQTLSQHKYKIESLDSKIKMLEQNSARYYEEVSSIESEEHRRDDELDDLNSELAKYREELQVRINELQASEKILSQKELLSKNAELNKVKLESEILSTVKETENYKSQFLYIQKRVEQLKIESEHNIELLDKLEQDLMRGKDELNNKNDEYTQARTDRDYLKEEKKSFDEQILQFTNALGQKRKEFDKFIDKIHQIELKISESKTLLNNIRDRAIEAFELDLETADLSFEEEISLENAKAELADIKEKLNQLGNVNFMALDEFETASQRMTFYSAQVKDLTESEKTLQETIEEINQTAEEKFLTTFDVVRKNFIKLFKTLFSDEGEADIILAEGNPLECDIEIMAKPPGKKPHSIDMLSGGEKTLTAIALLFAIYLVKPSPFCILDEVDAPLDDANIDKFLNMIKEFSKNTQFLIVTHNKKTMSAAATLYGVTMAEEGVSKIVSVQLTKESN